MGYHFCLDAVLSVRLKQIQAQACSQHLDASVCTQQLWPVIVQLQQQQQLSLAIIRRHNWEQELCWTISVAHPRRCEMECPCSKALTEPFWLRQVQHIPTGTKSSASQVNRVAYTNQMGLHPRLSGNPVELQGILQGIRQGTCHNPSLC